MTRKKDKKSSKKESIRTFKHLNKSRLFQKNQEETKEILLLKKIQCLPKELIRIINGFLSGKAKLFCNFKFDYLEKITNKFDFYFDLDTLLQSFSKKDVCNLVCKGVLKNFPDIIETIDDFYYCLDVHEFMNVRGNRLFDLWDTNGLINTYDETSSQEEKISNINWSIKSAVKHAIYNYINNFVKLYRKNKDRTISQKNWNLTRTEENTLFLNLDRVFYLFKCFENLLVRKRRS